MTDRAACFNIVAMPTMTPTRSADRRAERSAVRVLLAAKNLSQRKLAVCVGTDAPTLSRLLNGAIEDAELWKRVWLALTSEGSK
jgi:hypothetical protein